MLHRLSRRVLRAASREVSASPSAPALVASPPWLAPWRVASLSTSARAGSSGTRESTAADEAECRKRQRRAARRADRQHLRAWASDDSRWDEPHGASRRPSSGARRRRVVHWADEVSADARANEAFAREACEMGWSGTGTRGGPKGGGTARVKYKHRNERDTRRRRGTGGESPRDSRQERLDRERDRAHARDEPFFREDAWWYEENGGTRRTDARDGETRRFGAPRARRRRLRRRRSSGADSRNASSRSAFAPRFTATIAEASASVTRDFTSTSTSTPLATVRAGRIVRRGRGSR